MRTDNACAASLPDSRSSPSISSRTVYRPPGPTPTRLPSTSASACVPVNTSSRDKVLSTTAAVKSFNVLAGR